MTRCFRVVDLRVSIFILLSVSFSLHIQPIHCSVNVGGTVEQATPGLWCVSLFLSLLILTSHHQYYLRLVSRLSGRHGYAFPQAIQLSCGIKTPPTDS